MNWKDDTFSMTLDAAARGVSNTAASAKVTLTDVSVAPVVKFTPASIKLTERSQTTTTVTVEAGDDKEIPEAISAITGALRLMVSDPKMVSVGAAGSTDTTGCNAEDAPPVYISGDVGTLEEMGDDAGSFNLTAIGANIGADAMQETGVTLTIEACDETMDFRDAMITLMPTASFLDGRRHRPW